MSLYGALYAGVSGLGAQSNALGVISDNIANTNTIGYKEGQGTFQTLVTGANNATSYSPGGVLGGDQQLVSTQGLLQTTSSPSDIAISGAGMIVVNQKPDGTGQVLYTRAGSFTQDSSGNYVNTAGYFLQAWPLDSSGALPGAPGNADTTSSANLSSLQTVNVQNLTGTATGTSTVSLGANLNAGQTAALGAGAVVTMDSLDASNFNINANEIIIPTAVDKLTRGDQFTVATSSGISNTYTYGGFSFSRSVTASGSVSDYGDSAVANPVPVALNNVKLTLSSSTPTSVIVNANPVTLGLAVGDVINLANTSGASGIGVDGLNGIDGNAIVTAVNGSSNFTVTLSSTTTPPAPVSLNGVTFTATNGSANIVISSPPPVGMAVGDQVEIANGPAIAAAGLLASDMTGTFAVSAVTAGTSYTITIGKNATGNGSNTGAANTTAFDENGTFANASAATYTNRLFAASGDILDATNPTQSFLGVTGTTGFTDASLSFTIATTATGTVKFTYTASAPNAQLGQFNNFTNLATAIGDVAGLTARVVNGRLYVGATDSNAAVTFANVAATGTAGPPMQAGIDWVGELGLANVAASAGGSNRFATMQSLADDVNASSGVTATVDNPAGNADVKINVNDPLTTVTFTDGGASSDTNVGSVLAALGMVPSLNGGAFSQKTTGALGPAYDPSNSSKNMASGAIPAQFSRPVTVYDAQGTAHNLNVAFLKTGTNAWAVEIYAQPAGDVVSSLPNGQVANGTMTFNGDGTLRSVSSSLSAPVTVDWTDGASPATLTFNWGTANKTDGLSQFNSSYNVNFVNQNGTPVGQLTGISINSSGIITASYNNGQTQKLYQIPLAAFADPNQLQGVDGNAYAQTSGSGVVNLKQSGSSGVGTISSGALEQSNVDLATQLTNMIVALRAYEANTKVISTANSLLNALDQIIQ
ncbi:MAG: flagellar hook-basal body complex protein [Pseudomonadota bacterium]|nr:flagellar hook-basal body complex protein [Pseudomonadota bacterium]